MSARRPQAGSAALLHGTGPPDAEARQVAQALGLLRHHLGVDFTAYRPRMIRRRLDGRMRIAGHRDLGSYVVRLQEDAEERARLFTHLTIKVTRFHRNTTSFDRLREVMLAAADARTARRPFRVWSAGCSTGEEAWTLAMLLEECGLPAGGHRPQVQATDVDERTLEHARRRRYPRRAFVELPDRLAQCWSRPADDAPDEVDVDPRLAGRVEFRLHDLVAAVEPPLGWRFDLVCCRNVLIYLDERRRRRVVSLLLRALVPGGHLFLGEAEWPEPEDETVPLLVVDHRARLFQRPHTTRRGLPT